MEIGLVVTYAAVGSPPSRPVVRASILRPPRETVPSINGRADEPFAKKSLAVRALFLG